MKNVQERGSNVAVRTSQRDDSSAMPAPSTQPNIVFVRTTLVESVSGLTFKTDEPQRVRREELTEEEEDKFYKKVLKTSLV